MTNNYIVSCESVLPIDGSISDCNFFVRDEDIEILINDSVLRKDFLNKLGVDKVVLSNIGELKGDVYESKTLDIIKVGGNKWKSV